MITAIQIALQLASLAGAFTAGYFYAKARHHRRLAEVYQQIADELQAYVDAVVATRDEIAGDKPGET